ncbi:MAG: hypothetical protein WCO79_02385 [bacterium]
MKITIDVCLYPGTLPGSTASRHSATLDLATLEEMGGVFEKQKAEARRIVSPSNLILAKRFEIELTPRLLKELLVAHTKGHISDYVFNFSCVTELHRHCLHLISLRTGYDAEQNTLGFINALTDMDKVGILISEGWELLNEGFARKHGLI